MKTKINKNVRTALPAVLISALLLVLISGCENVIEVDLKNAGPRLVIEGHISNVPDQSYFVLSHSTDFYQPNDVEFISDAEIIITDDFGAVDTIFESSGFPGLYVNPNVFGVPGRSYMATVVVDGVTYLAESNMPDAILIDSMSTEYQEGGGVGSEEDEGYRLHVYFQDNIEIRDYARIKIRQNDEMVSNYYLYDGKFSDGNPIDYEYFLETFQLGDTLSVELFSMDSEMYDYFLTLQEVIAGDEMGNISDATPANPNTNWSGNVLGYFGAFYSSQQEIIAGE